MAAHTELMWFLSCLTPLSWLNKMIQFKEKKAGKRKYQPRYFLNLSDEVVRIKPTLRNPEESAMRDVVEQKIA